MWEGYQGQERLTSSQPGRCQAEGRRRGTGWATYLQERRPRVFERGVGGRSKGQVSMWGLLQRLDATVQPTHHGIMGTEWNLTSAPARKSF